MLIEIRELFFETAVTNKQDVEFRFVDLLFSKGYVNGVDWVLIGSLGHLVHYKEAILTPY